MDSFGCRPSKKDLRDYKIKASAEQAGNLPDTFALPKLTEIKDQDIVNSCVAHGMASILEYHGQGKLKLSTNFIYGIKNQLFNDRSQGMFLKDACAIATKYGDMLYEDCPGNDEVPYCYNKAESAFYDEEKLKTAYTFRLNSYYTCESDDDIKLAIVKYGPVLGCVKWYNGSKTYEDGTLKYDTNKKSSYHCIVIYGWDEKGWLCQNSWGADWGDNGYFILPYEYGIHEARAIVDEYNPDEVELIIPKTNKFLDFIYKILNFFVNLLKREE